MSSFFLSTYIFILFWIFNNFFVKEDPQIYKLSGSMRPDLVLLEGEWGEGVEESTRYIKTLASTEDETRLELKE